jgi:hypothetical protein
MGANGYRAGRRQVNVVLSVALHARVRGLAAASGCSMQEWLVEAVRERVRDGDFGGSVVGGGVAADVGGPGGGAVCDGSDSAGVVAGVGDDARLTVSKVRVVSSSYPMTTALVGSQVPLLPLDESQLQQVGENVRRSLAADWDDMVASQP